MSMQRLCRKCGVYEGIRCNFGDNREAEAEFHNQDWHDCANCKCKENDEWSFGCTCKLKNI